MTRHTISTCLITAAFLLLASGNASAISTDIQVFSAGGPAPNILFLMDSSGSMGSSPDSCPACPAKWDLARQAVADMVVAINPPDGGGGYTQNARMGLFQFEGSKGGRLLVPITDGNEDLMIATALAASQAGGTPLGRALVDMARYYAGPNQWGSLPIWGDGSIKGESPEPSPIDLECRQNFIVAMSDGNSKTDGPGKYGNTGGGVPTLCDTIGAGDGDGDAEGCGSGTDWMDDAAWAMYRYDFSPLPGMQNLTVHTIGFDSDPQVLKDTADNAGGTYQFAADGIDLEAAYITAVLRIFDGLVAFTSATVSSSRTAFSDHFFNTYFHAKTNEAFWAGHLQAFRITPSLDVVDSTGAPALDPVTGEVVGTPFWDVHNRLLDPLHPARTIYTTQAGARASFDTASIAAADLGVVAADLTAYPNDPNVPFADEEALTDAIVNYLYGQDAFDEDRDLDPTELREAVLGDIFHSSPLVIGTPPFGLSTEDGFAGFLALYGKRDRRLYVGANDGMLHAIDAGQFLLGDNPATPEIEIDYYDLGTGNEEFAWVPGMLHDTLKHIPINVPKKYFYVDGSPTAADAWFPVSVFDTVKDPEEWTTVLITGMREGGAGYLALDVTDPAATLAVQPHGPYPKHLWEFNDPNEPLADAWSEAIITRVKLEGPLGTGDHCGPDDGDGDCREQWVAIFAGGHNQKGDAALATYLSDPNNAAWTDDSKAIFVVSIDTGAVLARVMHDPLDATFSDMKYAIPSTPAVLDLDFDGFVDVIFIGDTGGQIWKWDVSAVGTDGFDADTRIDNWPAGVFFRSDPVDIGGGVLHYRSFFFPPSASFIDGDLVLSFGSGERTNLNWDGVAGVDDNNRLFVIRDPDPMGASAIPATPYSESDLTDVTNKATDDDPSDLGFYLVGEDGEKFVTNSITFAGFLIAGSYDLGGGGGPDPCAGASGESFVYIFNLESGLGFFDPALSPSAQGRRLSLGGGVPSDPAISTSADGGTKVIIKSSTGGISVVEGPSGDGALVDMVYWKQDF